MMNGFAKSKITVLVLVLTLLLTAALSGVTVFAADESGGQTGQETLYAKTDFSESTWASEGKGEGWMVHFPNYFSFADERLAYTSSAEGANFASSAVWGMDYLLEFDISGLTAHLALILNASATSSIYYNEKTFLFLETTQIEMPGQTTEKITSLPANWATGTVRLRLRVLPTVIVVYGADVTDDGAVGAFKLLGTFENFTAYNGGTIPEQGHIVFGPTDLAQKCTLDNVIIRSLSENSNSIQEDFTDNQYDTDMWTLENGGPAGTLTGDNVRGLLVEDGMLKFAGTSYTCRFKSKGIYREFVLQFDYITYDTANRPALDDGMSWSWCGIWFNRELDEGSTSYDGKGILLQDHQVSGTFSSVKNESMPDLFTNWGKSATYRVRVEVIGNTVAVYTAPVVEQIVGAWKNVVQFQTNEGEMEVLTSDPVGYFAFTSDEGGYWSIDNISLTPLAAIGDLPAFDTARRLSLREREDGSGQYVRWNPVAFAESYEVVVDDGQAVQVTANEYDLPADLAEGKHTVKVRAIGWPEYFISGEWAELEIELTAESDPGTSDPGTDDPGTSDPDTDEKSQGGCNGSIAAVGVAGTGILCAAVAAVLIKKKEK